MKTEHPTETARPGLNLILGGTGKTGSRMKTWPTTLFLCLSALLLLGIGGAILPAPAAR